MARKIIKVKHHLSSGCCMCSGIEDLYATKTNQSIPEGFLLALGSFGETVFIKMNNSEKTYMFSANDARPKTVYENLKDEIGLEYKIIGGRTIEYSLKTVKKEIDEGFPVILGPLDMFYLPYLKMYQKEHIPIHYIMAVGYDEEKNCILIYDCDRKYMIELSVNDLFLAWNIEKNGVGDKSGFIKIRLGEKLPNKYKLAYSCLLRKAERQFREKPYILGISAYEKIAKELPKWKKKFSESEYKKALISITEYMGKVPKIPNQIMGIKETDIPYRANYDRLAKIICELGKEYKQDNWIKSAELFNKCGKNIEKIVAYIVQYCCNGIDRTDKISGLFLENANYAKEAYKLIQETKINPDLSLKYQ